MSGLTLKNRLILLSVASIYMAVGYMLMSVAFTLEGFMAYDLWSELVNRFVTSLKDFAVVFWFVCLGSFFWTLACYLLAAYVGGFLRLAATIVSVAFTVWTILLFYLAINFQTIFIDLVYSYDLSHLLARILPYFFTAVNCLSLVLFSAGIALRFKSVFVSFLSALAVSVFTISAAAFLLNLNGSLPSAFFIVILPAGFSLFAIASFWASVESKA